MSHCQFAEDDSVRHMNRATHPEGLYRLSDLSTTSNGRDRFSVGRLVVQRRRRCLGEMGMTMFSGAWVKPIVPGPNVQEA